MIRGVLLAWVLTSLAASGGVAFATESQEELGESVEAYPLGWYFNITETRVRELVERARDNNNRVANVIGYHVDGVGERFVLQIVDQPSSVLGMNPWWRSWRVRTGLTASQLRSYYQDQVVDEFYVTTNIDAYWTPNGVRYSITVYRFNDFMYNVPGTRRLSEPPRLHVAVPVRQWRVLHRRMMQQGRFLQSMTASWNDARTGIEVTGEFTGSQNIPQEHGLMGGGDGLRETRARALNRGLHNLNVDMLAGRSRSYNVHYFTNFYQQAGYHWDVPDGQNSLARGIDDEIFILAAVPLGLLQARLEQIEESGRTIRTVAAVYQPLQPETATHGYYPRGGAQGRVYFTLVLAGEAGLPDLPLDVAPPPLPVETDVAIKSPEPNEPSVFAAQCMERYRDEFQTRGATRTVPEACLDAIQEGLDEDGRAEFIEAARPWDFATDGPIIRPTDPRDALEDGSIIRPAGDPPDGYIGVRQLMIDFEDWISDRPEYDIRDYERLGPGQLKDRNGLGQFNFLAHPGMLEEVYGVEVIPQVPSKGGFIRGGPASGGWGLVN